jgi:hypothetical protein
MTLTASQRLALDSSISSAISNIPILMDKWNQERYIRNYQINDLREFLYGHILGIVSNSLYNIIFISEGRATTSSEIQEAEEVISRRLPEIRNSIGKEVYYNRARR